MNLPPANSRSGPFDGGEDCFRTRDENGGMRMPWCLSSDATKRSGELKKLDGLLGVPSLSRSRAKGKAFLSRFVCQMPAAFFTRCTVRRTDDAVPRAQKKIAPFTQPSGRGDVKIGCRQQVVRTTTLVVGAKDPGRSKRQVPSCWVQAPTPCRPYRKSMDQSCPRSLLEHRSTWHLCPK